MLQKQIDDRNLRIVDIKQVRKLETRLTTLVDLSIMNANGDCEEGGGGNTGSAEVDLMGTLTDAEGVVADSFV